MALNHVFVFLLAIATFAPIITSAKEFIVGDDMGWTVGFDYQAWANDKVFYVGDKLVFQYPAGAHNVFKVNGTSFQNCEIPASDNQALKTGNDIIVLATPGRKWYICGVGNHCELGQKLVITVLPPQAEAPAPSLAPSPHYAMKTTKRPFTFRSHWWKLIN
ncbi:blue copper protein-like [Melia azedarach]|uniref:Blue copper protein-like n=1 Tax=Melia azedarach TaxID=155640 RepID=A0ACC1YDC1_MELAZ|nr:blue copper protein-like [Melia azedarach]